MVGTAQERLCPPYDSAQAGGSPRHSEGTTALAPALNPQQTHVRRWPMGRYLLLWLLGVPIPILVLIYAFGGLH
jgi:hypothetical protein